MTIPHKTLNDFYNDADKEHIANTARLEETGKRLRAELAAIRIAQAADRNPDPDPEARIQSLISGTNLPHAVPWATQTLEKQSSLRDVDRALDVMAAKKRIIDEAANQRLLDAITVAHDAAAKTLAEAMIAARQAHLVYFSAKRHLVGNGLNLGSLFNIDAEPLLGIPKDKSSDMALFLRDCVKHGYLRAMPEGL